MKRLAKTRVTIDNEEKSFLDMGETWNEAFKEAFLKALPVAIVMILALMLGLMPLYVLLGLL